MIFSVIVRLAMRSGYHKDPSHYPQMTIFESEMRRRVWALLMQLDLVFSSSLGLPRLIDDRQTDTAPPLNLMDEDLDPDMTEPPRSRPESEQTWIGYMNHKTKMLTILGKIVDRTTSMRDLSYSEVLELEKDIQMAGATKPTWLELPNDGLATLPISALTRLLALDLIGQRARMILHRKFLIAALSNPSYSYSRQCCLTAATRALQYQKELFELSRAPDGLISSSWRFFSLMTNDFLLAAMIVCLDLDQALLRRGMEYATDGGNVRERQDRSKRFELLENSYRIWRDSMSHSSEASKAAEVLRIMLDRVKQTKEAKFSTEADQVSFENLNRNSEDVLVSQDTLSFSDSQTKPPSVQTSTTDTRAGTGFDTMDATLTENHDPFNLRANYTNPDAQVFQNILSSPSNFDWVSINAVTAEFSAFSQRALRSNGTLSSFRIRD